MALVAMVDVIRSVGSRMTAFYPVVDCRQRHGQQADWNPVQLAGDDGRRDDALIGSIAQHGAVLAARLWRSPPVVVTGADKYRHQLRRWRQWISTMNATIWQTMAM
jgi:hypothetical protein